MDKIEITLHTVDVFLREDHVALDADVVKRIAADVQARIEAEIFRLLSTIEGPQRITLESDPYFPYRLNVKSEHVAPRNYGVVDTSGS